MKSQNMTIHQHMVQTRLRIVDSSKRKKKPAIDKLCHPYSLDPQAWQNLYDNAAAISEPDRWLYRFLAVVDQGLVLLYLEDDEAHLLFAPALLRLQSQPHLAAYGSEALLHALNDAIQELDTE